MADSVASLRHKIASAEDLEAVVRTMKAMAASSIGQYEHAVQSLEDYYRAVQLGLSTCIREQKSTQAGSSMKPKENRAIGAIVFGSDQGLVGQFNDVMVEFTVDTLSKLPKKKCLCVVGERVGSRLADAGLTSEKNFNLPNSINAITPLVGQILIEIEAQRENGVIDEVYVFHHRPASGSIYTPVCQQLLPLDAAMQHELTDIHWPTKCLPQVLNAQSVTLNAFIREYLFVTLFRACAESLASENASRLAAMQRAEKNIGELQEDLTRTYHRLRQGDIDEELFDVISGFEALRHDL